MKLTENETFVVNTENELEELLRTLDNSTHFLQIDGNDLEFKVVENDLHEINYGSMNPDLQTESLTTGVFLYVPSIGEYLPMGEHAIEDLQNFVGLRGEGVTTHCKEEIDLLKRLIENKIDKYVPDETLGYAVIQNGKSLVEKRLQNGVAKRKEFAFTIMWREDPETGDKKIFSVRTKMYQPIKQAELLRARDCIQMLGKTHEMHRAEVDHFVTKVYEVFPEVGEEFSKAFNFSMKILPGFRFRTSDTGDSSFCIERFLYIEDSNKIDMDFPLPPDDYEKRRVSIHHYGKEKDFKEIRNSINIDLFNTFKTYPEKIARLMAVGDINIEAGLTAAFAAMNLRKTGSILSEEREKRLVKEIKEVCFENESIADAYDVVMAAMTATEIPEITLSDAQRDNIRPRALMALRADYESFSVPIGNGGGYNINGMLA